MGGGEFFTRATVWLALVGYAAGAGLLLLSGRRRLLRPARWAWSFGCAWFLAHVGCAFAYYYRWSHTTAYRETARQTGEIIGTPFGGGVFVSYLFTLAWLADVLWWWLGRESYERRPRALTIILHGFLFFIIFNGTVVFESGPARWLGAFVCAGLAVLWLSSRRGAARAGHRLRETEG